jgi:hypothetical protein
MENITISKKIKGIIAILFLSISFYMMKTTMYTRALGDYVLEFIGLKSWSGDFRGMHLTVIYFGILTIILLYVVLNFAVGKCGIRKRWVLLLVIIFINIFSFITDATARNIKKNSNGLQTIGFNSENSKMEYQSKDMKYTKFNAEIELANYGNESEKFSMTIDGLNYKEDGINGIDIFTQDGKKAVFELDGNETEIFRINLDEYKISGGRVSKNGGGKGTIKDIILIDENNNKIRLDKNNFFGIELNEK